MESLICKSISFQAMQTKTKKAPAHSIWTTDDDEDEIGLSGMQLIVVNCDVHINIYSIIYYMLFAHIHIHRETNALNCLIWFFDSCIIQKKELNLTFFLFFLSTKLHHVAVMPFSSIRSHFFQTHTQNILIRLCRFEFWEIYVNACGSNGVKCILTKSIHGIVIGRQQCINFLDSDFLLLRFLCVVFRISTLFLGSD